MSATRPSPRASESAHRAQLRREVFPPRPSAKTALLLLATSTFASLAVVMTAIGLAASAGSASPEATRKAPAVVHVVRPDDSRPGGALPAMGEPYTEPTPAEDLPPGAKASLVTELDGRLFVTLDDAPEDLLDPASFAVVGEDLQRPEGAIAAVDESALPGELAAWKERKVRVGAACRSQVEGFAVISPMVGTLDYMPVESLENPEEAEIVRALLDSGSPLIAAELEGCAGVEAPALARDAELPPAAAPEAIDRPELEEKARAHLLSSAASEKAQRDHAGVRKDAKAWWKLPSAEIEARALRHPETGAITISVSASADRGCGYGASNLWGLYRVDERGAIEPLAIHELEPGTRLLRAFDVEGEGELSWLAEHRFGGSVLFGQDGDARTEIEMPFFGCPC